MMKCPNCEEPMRVSSAGYHCDNCEYSIWKRFIPFLPLILLLIAAIYFWFAGGLML